MRWVWQCPGKPHHKSQGKLYCFLFKPGVQFVAALFSLSAGLEGGLFLRSCTGVLHRRARSGKASCTFHCGLSGFRCVG